MKYHLLLKKTVVHLLKTKVYQNKEFYPLYIEKIGENTRCALTLYL